MKKIIWFAWIGLALWLGGCSSVKTEFYDKDGKITQRVEDSRCVVQSHSVVLGLDVEVFDFMGTGGSSPTKIRLGYICADINITPYGMASEFSKDYENVLWGTNKFTTTDKAYMVIGK